MRRASPTSLGDPSTGVGADENTLPFSTTVPSFNNDIGNRLFPTGAHQHPRYRRQQQLPLNAGGSEPPVATGPGVPIGFTWAKNLADNQGPDNTVLPARRRSALQLDPDRHADFGNVGGTRRLRWNSTVLYDLPVGRGKHFGSQMPRVADLIVGGWRLSSIVTVQTVRT